MKTNKPVRISDEVKRELLKMKQEKELRSIDAVLKKLLKKQKREGY
jgi:predicted CopG family antitoxin